MNATDRILAEVRDERTRQEAKWGPQHHPDGTGGPVFKLIAAKEWREECDTTHRAGNGEWVSILLEEVYEALAESDPAKLRAELIQVAAVAVNWVEDIDSRVTS